MEDETISPLMPKEALEYYIDASAGTRLYLRATSIRNCLENIVETIFVHIIDDKAESGWRKKNLFEKLELIKDFFPEEINKRLHDIRKLGNNGTHPSLHKYLVEDEVNFSLQDLSKICEWAILAYFKKKGFVDHPWIPTVFSILPPIYRVRILEELIEDSSIDKSKVIEYLENVQIYHQVITGEIPPVFEVERTENDKRIEGFLLSIDKLAMAYLKNRERVKSFEFIVKMYKSGYINSVFKDEMFNKLNSLWGEIENLPISKSISESKRYLDEILPAVRENEESLFITIFTAIVVSR